ncbi:MAG: ERCC4 domain-containing protein [Candidatus Nitrosocaldus sp.]|nr:helix-hairpin-helix domain-containing protein [Candidatus Nitrosocaldus sp.]MDW8275768.1 ERCC4 domain-containing protein [Candidatus Nitrosocaldus sp.]
MSKQSKRLRVVVDERERRSGVPDALKELGIYVDYATLDVGDYIVHRDCCVERKSVDDLINSIYDARLFIQVDGMLKHYPSPVLIIEGSSTSLSSVDKPGVLYGAIASLVVEFKVPTVFTPSPTHTAVAIAALARHFSREDDDAREPMLRRIRKDRYGSLREQQLGIIASIPGIGGRLAQRLLERFNSPINVLNASLADLARVKGVGYAKARRIRYTLDTDVSGRVTGQRTLNDYRIGVADDAGYLADTGGGGTHVEGSRGEKRDG